MLKFYILYTKRERERERKGEERERERKGEERERERKGEERERERKGEERERERERYLAIFVGQAVTSPKNKHGCRSIVQIFRDNV